jgi:cellulose synthase/poly-beta-1,6-N-acetylglucosamine synthase-like glycosyltransferase
MNEQAPTAQLSMPVTTAQIASASDTPKRRAERKSSLMFVSVLLFYFGCAVTLNPRLLALFVPSTGWVRSLVLTLFIVQLNLFWLFGSYYLMLGLFTAISWLTRTPGPAPVRQGPPVAVLYLTMNDFQERAALSCMRQNYDPCHLFILDDSVDTASRVLVDAFAERHPGVVTVVRRLDREGYKAGSINSALRNHVHGYKYFIVVDSDSVLPEEFTGQLVPYFDLGENIGWVQGSHAPNPVQKTSFADDLGLGILPLWEVYYGPRNRFGTVVFLGHGGMLRYDVWEQVGGFPEIVSEDLAFSTEAAQLGYRGYFAHDVVSYEDFPEGYRQFRRQQAKYVKGACEYLHRSFLPYFKSPSVNWFEKLDVLISCGTLFIPTLVLTFMIVISVLMPLLFGVQRPLTLHFLGRDVITVPVLLLPVRFRNVWSWWYFAVTVVCTLSPALGWFCVMARKPRRGIKLFLLSGIPYLSLLVMSTATVISYLLSKRAVFLVTGDRWGVDPRSFPQGYSPDSRVAERIGADDRLTLTVELALGTTFIITCVFTLNLVLMAFALALLLGPLLLRVSWNSRPLRPLLLLPFVCVCCGLLLDATNIGAVQGATMSMFYFHF